MKSHELFILSNYLARIADILRTAIDTPYLNRSVVNRIIELATKFEKIRGAGDKNALLDFIFEFINFGRYVYERLIDEDKEFHDDIKEINDNIIKRILNTLRDYTSLEITIESILADLVDEAESFGKE